MSNLKCVVNALSIGTERLESALNSTPCDIVDSYADAVVVSFKSITDVNTFKSTLGSESRHAHLQQ